MVTIPSRRYSQPTASTVFAARPCRSARIRRPNISPSGATLMIVKPPEGRSCTRTCQARQSQLLLRARILARVGPGKTADESEDEMSWRFFALSALGLTMVVPPHPTLAAGQEPVKSSRSSPAARTPWGDPNLQGHFTNKYEQNTPLERPKEFEGRRVEDVTGPELAEVLAKREQQVLERPLGVGPYQFRDNLEVTKASWAWLVIDPSDGRIPPLTAE